MSAFRIAQSQTPEQKSPRIKNNEHLRFIRKLPCIICGACNSTEAAHTRYSSIEHGKRPTGMAERPDDKWCTPLCGHCHRTGPNAQHSTGERTWWVEKGIDPLKVASALYAVSGDVDKGTEIIFEARNQ